MAPLKYENKLDFNLKIQSITNDKQLKVCIQRNCESATECVEF